MEVELERHPRFLLLRISGDLRLWSHPHTEERLLGLLYAALEEKTERVLLSLRGLTLIDSLGIAALVRVPISCLRRSLDVKVVMPAGAPGEALKQLGIFWAWPVYEDEAAAVRAYTEVPSA
jgi:anti-anti-sigma regulatory factor